MNQKKSIVVFFLLAFLNTLAAQNSWIKRNPLPTGVNLNSVIFADGNYFAAGARKIISSVDGINWKETQCPINSSSICKGPNCFVTAGAYGGISYSSDGSEWTKSSARISRNLYSVVWGSDKFVAIGDGDTCYFSADGKDWTPGYVDNEGYFPNFVYWSGKQFIAAGDAGYVYLSSDGLTWKNFKAPTPCDLYGVAGNESVYVAVGGEITSSGDQSIILTSTDGQTWTKRISNPDEVLLNVTYAAGTFVASGYTSSGSVFYISKDGSTWKSYPVQFPGILSSLVYGKEQFVAVGDGGLVLTSKDGISWVNRSSGPRISMSDVAGGSGKYVAIEKYDALFDKELKRVVTSTDGGITWNTHSTGSSFVQYSIVWGKNKFVSVGFFGSVLTSPDGVTWTEQTSGTEYDLYDVAYGKETYVAVGNGTVILSSPDGVKWTARNSNDKDGLLNITWANDMFIAGGYNGQIFTSLDGITWSKHSSGLSNVDIVSVQWFKSIFVATDKQGNTAKSPDGVNWTASQRSNLTCKSIVHSGNTFVGIYDRKLYSSPDGLEWNREENGDPDVTFNAVCYDNSYFVAVGNDGIIYTSPSSSSINKPLQRKNAVNTIRVARGGFEFNLAVSSNVTISLFDLQGKLVMTLLQSFLASGVHYYSFPTNIAHKSYLLCLATNDKKDVCKIDISQ